MKKIIIKIALALFVVVTLFACKNKVQKTETKGLKEGVYIITNPYTRGSKVINEKGEVLLSSSDGDSDNYMTLVTDIETKKPLCIMKEIIGEKKITEYYETDEGRQSYDRASTRVEVYDLNGKKLDFDKEGISYINFAFGDNIFYENYDINKAYAYNVKTGVEKELGGENCIAVSNKVVSSTYTMMGKPSKLIIYDKNLNIIKTIENYAYDYELDYKGKKCIRVSTCSTVDGKYRYNYLDENLNLMYDAPVDDDGYGDKNKNQDTLSSDEYEKILAKLQEVSEDIKYFQKMTYDGVTLYIADYSYEDKNTHEWIYTQRIFDENLKEKTGDFKTVQRVFDRSGLILVDDDTFLDFNMNVVKKFDRKSTWQEDEKWGKIFLYDSCDENYYSRDDFSLYDRNFNVILSGLKRINIPMIPDYIVAEDKQSTKLYDKDMKVVKDYGRSLEIYGWSDSLSKMHSFVDNTTNLQGIMDGDWNIIIDNLKSVSEMRDTYFTFQKGFRYGLMDYAGNVLIDFSIFDSTSEEKQMVDLTNIDYPRVDGSTANMPMMAQIRADYLGENLTDSENMVNVTTTDYAWRNLLEGKNDLLLVYEPSSETKKIIEESGVKLKITPIGVDALVFIENVDNPINNLKTTELQDIYEGKVTNWKEVGGDDKNIEAFQRPLNSGSQTLFLNLLMKGKTPMDAKTEYRPEGMDDLIEVVASFKNTANAIGYSVYYYAKKMYQNPNLKLISVDGVMPTDESIASGEYPFLNQYYLVIREDTPKDSEIMKLYNFILSDKGTEAIRKAGYIPIS